MPRLVVVSIPGYNNSWWWGFGIPGTGTFQSLPIIRRRSLTRLGPPIRTGMHSSPHQIPHPISFNLISCYAFYVCGHLTPKGASTMEWVTPQHEEIDLNCEVSSYANAEL